MSEPSAHRALIARYLDGAASEAELAELGRLLDADPRAADALADASRMEAWLAQHFRQEHSNGLARAVAERAGSAEPAPTHGARAAVWRRLAAGAAVAAAAAIVLVALALWPAPGRRRHQVLAGRVLSNGTALTTIASGTTIRVTGEDEAVIRLADGSRATLEPATCATLHGEAEGLRQLVALHEGGGVFAVERAQGRFQVRTPVGSVTALGTEFSVRLVPPTDDGAGDRQMKLRHVALAVAVMSGAVQVQMGDRSYVLGVGDNQLFAAEGDREAPREPAPPRVGEGDREGPRTRKLSGEITAVGGASILVTQRGDRGEVSNNIVIHTETRIRIETDRMETVPGEGGTEAQRPKVVDGTMAHLEVGQRVSVTCTENNQAIEIIVRRAAPPRRGEGEGDGPREPRPPRRGEGDREGAGRTRREGGEGDREGEARVRREGAGTREGDGQHGDGEHRDGEGKTRREGEGDREGEGRTKEGTTEPRRGEGDGGRTGRTLRGSGVLTSVTATSITITQRGDRGSRSKTLKLAATTKVLVEAGRREGGDGERGVAMAEGTLADLKVGQQVSATCTEDGTAIEITIHVPAPPRRDGEGERRREGEG